MKKNEKNTVLPIKSYEMPIFKTEIPIFDAWIPVLDAEIPMKSAFFGARPRMMKAKWVTRAAPRRNPCRSPELWQLWVVGWSLSPRQKNMNSWGFHVAMMGYGFIWRIRAYMRFRDQKWPDKGFSGFADHGETEHLEGKRLISAVWKMHDHSK